MTASTSSKRVGNKKTGSLSLQQKLNNYLLEKLVRWVIAERVDEGRPSWFRWDPEDKKLLAKIIRDPESAGLHLDASDTKYRAFFQSIIDNGFNTADVQLFYRYRDQLPLRKLNWLFDLRDFKQEQGVLRSSAMLPEGFYMVELQARPSRFSSRIPLRIHRTDARLDEPQAFDAEHHTQDDFSMSIISHRTNKRLIWLRSSGYLDIVSDHPEPMKTVTHLRLARTTRSFMIDRMMKKLGQEFKAELHAKMTDEKLERLWKTYDERFTYQYDPVAAYQRFLSSQTQNALPVDRDKQIADLTVWLKRSNRH